MDSSQNENLSKEEITKMLSELENREDLILCEDEHHKGGFGEVLKVKDEKFNIYYSVKVISPQSDDEPLKERIKEFRGKNIIKINKDKVCDNNYYLYLMEYSSFGDLKKFITKYYKSIGKNKKKSDEEINKFFKPFLEDFGDNISRYFINQIFYAMRTLYLGNLVHYDIKPSNIVLFEGLVLKIIDFSLLKKIDEKDGRGIPGGSYGYRTPESYESEDVMEQYDDDILRKQDYFAIGSTIFYLKYGQPMLKYNQDISDTEEGKYLISNRITDSLEMAINYIKSQKYQNKDFTKFLCSLIAKKPEDRPNFEEIIRNKWLNKNSKEIEIIVRLFEMNEDNLMLELKKSDFLINKKEYFRKNYEEINKEKKNTFNKKGKFKFIKL